MIFRKLYAAASSGAGPGPATPKQRSHRVGLAFLVLAGPGASGRLAAGTAAATGGAIELIDDVGAAILVSLIGEPHVALGQICPLRPQRRARFPGSAGTQMCGERTISVGGAHWLRRLLKLCLSTHHRKPSRWSPVPRLTKNSQLFDRKFSELCTLAFPPGSQANGALTKFRSQG